jgi:hypothetical protein
MEPITLRSPGDDFAARRHFLALSADEQAGAIRRLAATGMSDHGIAHATRLSVEFIRRVIAKAAP